MSLIKTKSNIRFIQGNEACAEAAIAAGVRFFAGYPITPSTEIAEVLSRRLPQVGGKFIQMEDEIAGIGAALGGALTGLKSMTATSGPGFSLKQELLGFACLCEIPCVIVNVQRGGPSTGLPTAPGQGDVMQARWGTHGDHTIIVLSPSSVKEMYDLTVTAINFSEKFRIPVILLADEVVGHLYERIELPAPETLTLEERPRPKGPRGDSYFPYKVESPKDTPEIADFGDGFRFNVTGLIHDLDGFPNTSPENAEYLVSRLHEKIHSHMDEICLIEIKDIEESSVILCSYGSTSRSCDEAANIARSKGLKVGIIKLKTLWPFPDFIFDKIAGKHKTVVVCEMNMGQIINEVRRVANGRFKVDGVLSWRGTMLTPEEILKKIKTIIN